jgi:hypothetical protein
MNPIKSDLNQLASTLELQKHKDQYIQCHQSFNDLKGPVKMVDFRLIAHKRIGCTRIDKTRAATHKCIVGFGPKNCIALP